MTRRLLAGAAMATCMNAATVVNAQEPHVLSEEVQQYAIEAGLADKLDIDWSDASAEQIAQYIHALAAVDITAQERAAANDRDEPIPEDYAAASFAWCWLPNSPPKNPEVSKFLVGLPVGSYATDEKQDAIRMALGPTLLSSSTEDLRTFATRQASMEEYSAQILDIQHLLEATD